MLLARFLGSCRINEFVSGSDARELNKPARHYRGGFVY